MVPVSRGNLRPRSLLNKSHEEIYDIIKHRNLAELSFESLDSFSFLVKWSNYDYNFCTWESEYFMRRYYRHVVEYAKEKMVSIEETQQDEENNRQSSKETAYTVSRCVSPLVGEKHKKWAKNISVAIEKQGVDALVVDEESCRLAIMYYISMMKEKQGSRPVLIVADKNNVGEWIAMITLYFPHLEYIRYSIQGGAEDRYDLVQYTSSGRYDILITDSHTYNVQKRSIMSIDVRSVILDIPTYTSDTHDTLRYMIRPYNRSSCRTICVYPSSPSDINTMHDISLLYYSSHNNPDIRCVVSSLYNNISQHMIDYYVCRGEKPPGSLDGLDISQHSVSSDDGSEGEQDIHLKYVIVRCSDYMKMSIYNIIYQNHVHFTSRDRAVMVQSVRDILHTIETASFGDESVGKVSKAIEYDSKLKYLLKYIEEKKTEDTNLKIILMFASPHSQARCLPHLQKLSKYSLWQVTQDNDSLDVLSKISDFNRIDKKLSILSIIASEVSRVSSVRCSNVMVYGYNDVSMNDLLKVH